MEYLVIELKPVARILCTKLHSDCDSEPIIFKDKNSAFRAADQCKQGLVYPIVDMMKIFDKIKTLANMYQCDCGNNILDELLAITDEII